MKINRIFLLLLAVITVFSLTACKGNGEVENNNNDNKPNGNIIIENTSGEVSGDEDNVHWLHDEYKIVFRKF